ncbi:FecR domain-containing protein [Erwinia sp. S38]|uniref:FecR family protein n=1 Tax=Erwinia sp. S38 TaxID=2769338 RepID=UPI00190A011D|nr:FecR domain-containing protein [Erwinia sp. S38]
MALNNDPCRPEDEVLEDEAIHWLVRMMSGSFSSAELKQFEAWRRTSPEHRAALSRATDLWVQLGKPLEASHRAILYPVDRVVASGWPFALPPKRAMMALFLLVISTIGCYQWMSYWRFNYATRLGEFREVSLNDGSTMWLNTDSAANVEISGSQRHVTLARGEAFFDVKHDEQLPFTVDAGSGHIRVLGTAFGVKIDGENTVVTVQRGKVSVSGDRQKTVTVDPDRSVTLNPSDNSLTVAQVDAARQLAWQKGLLIFENNTLNEIVHTLGHYDSRAVYLDYPQKDTLRLNASINIARVDDWYSQLEKALPLRVTRLGPVIWIRQAPGAG